MIRPPAVRFAFACIVASLLGSTALAQPLPSIRVVTLASDTGAQGFYAQDMGFFKREGLDVGITMINPALLTAAVASGSYDIGESNVPSLVAAREHGQRFVMIAPSAVFDVKLPASTAILVARNSPVRTARDLTGKTVAVTGLKNIAQVSVQAWIDKNGGDSRSVNFIEMPFSTMIPALTQGRIDAAQFAEPVLDEGIEAGLRPLGEGPMYAAIGKRFTISVWFCTEDYATAHPAIVRRFARAIVGASRWANTHQKESAQILARWTKLPVSPTMPRVSYGDALIAAEVQPLIDVSAKYQAVTSSFPAKEMFATSVPSR